MRAFLLWIFLASAAQADACRQALVLALDVSGSVNETEFSQQVSGLATALNDPEVRNLILLGAGPPVKLAVFEWSSRNHQYLILPWTTLDSAEALDTAIVRIGRHQKVRAGLRTALGTALSYASSLLEQQQTCWRQTIDVSGDGESNIGPAPSTVYQLIDFEGITVNALVVVEGHAEFGETNNQRAARLKNYYAREVIRGAGAFTIVADGYVDYARAMKAKLIRELAPIVLGHLNAP